MLLPQLIQHVRGVEARIVTQLPGDHLQGFGIRIYEELTLAGDGPCMLPQIPTAWLDHSCKQHGTLPPVSLTPCLDSLFLQPDCSARLLRLPNEETHAVEPTILLQ
jgi:hypothetical protein